MTRPLAHAIWISVLVSGCRLAPSKPVVWNPVLEPTNFVYLEEVTADAVAHAQETAAALRDGDLETAGRDLAATRTALSKLEHYYIPMTEVRQLVYDADRLYHLHRTGDASQDLDKAKQHLVRIAASDGPLLEKAMEEPITAVDDLRRAMDRSDADVVDRLRVLGDRINLMTLKGELIVGEAQWPPVP